MCWFFYDRIYYNGKFFHAQWFCVFGIVFPRNTHVQVEVPPTASEHSQIKEMIAIALQTNKKPTQQLLTMKHKKSPLIYKYKKTQL